MKLWSNRKKKKNINPQLSEDLLNRTAKVINKMPPINILVAGKTGSGKSTLINALFRERLAETGVGMPVTQNVNRITKEGIPLTLYDTKGLELNADAQREVLVSLSQLIKGQQAKGEREAIHIVYYCLNANMARIEDYELEFITAIAQQIPVILVLTQTLGEENQNFELYMRQLAEAIPVKAVIPILAKDYRIQKDQIIEAFGLQKLIDTTLEIIPSDAHQAFINAQRIDIQRKVINARSWANTYITTAFGVGFAPVPISDAALLVPMQITMLAHITAIFGLSLDKAQIISMLAGIGGTGGVTLAGKFLVGSAFKIIPGIGSVTGGIISGSTASALTIGLAYSYIEVLRRITLAEAAGQDLKLKEIQQIMNQSLSQQLKTVMDIIPETSAEQLKAWLEQFR